MELQSTNPATGEVLRTFSMLDAEALQARIRQAADAASELREMPLDQRNLYLRKLASMLEDECDDLAREITLETGRRFTQVVQDVRRCAESCRYYATNSPRMLAPELLQSESRQAYVQWSPMGVVLAVAAARSPFLQAFRLAIPALTAGCPVLLKCEEYAPQSNLLVETLIRRAGFPRGAFTALLVENDLLDGAIGDERIASLIVRADAATARRLATKAGSLLRNFSVQITGCGSMVVMPSANIEKALEAAIAAVTGDSSIRRIVVHASIYLDFLNRLTEKLEDLRIGDPMREETQLGPMRNEQEIRHLQEQMKQAVSNGGRIATGGIRLVGKGFFYEPTILTDVPAANAIADAPVFLLYHTDDLQQALAQANAMTYSPAASIWTEEPSEQQQLITGVTAAAVSLNALPLEDPGSYAPPGRAKRSTPVRGVHPYNIREFLAAKTVSLGGQLPD